MFSNRLKCLIINRLEGFGGPSELEFLRNLIKFAWGFELSCNCKNFHQQVFQDVQSYC